jgi:diadenosine tetraphosphatase ApaH/serine/threonine PP2A family protein phosphatase
MRALIVSDVHANLPALKAVLEDAQGRGGWDEIWCLGDTVGYGPQPNECLAELQRHQLRIIAGNHDLAATGDLSTDEFNHAAAAAAVWTRTVLTPDHRDMLRGLPLRERWGPFLLAHGSPREPVWEYITSQRVAAANFECFSEVYCLVGHTHVPVIFRSRAERVEALDFPVDIPYPLGDERLIVNVGSVGQPRDGEPRSSYGLYDSEAATLIRHLVSYPISETQTLIRDAGLPDSLADRLSMGW